MTRLPSKGEFWRIFAAVNFLPKSINGTQKAVLGCLIDHANPENGLCYPSEALIAAEIGRPTRSVERAIADLLLTPYLARKRRNQSSNNYSINFDALLRVWDDYKSRGASHRALGREPVTRVRETVTPTQKPKSQPSEVADQPVKSGGSNPSEVAGKKENAKGKGEKKSRMASPLRGDGATALLRLPAGEVKNLGGLLARFERAFTNDPEGIRDLDEWYDWLYEVASGERGDPNVERAIRLFQDVFDFQESRDAA